ncbi:MAG: DNA recombination protein RmuC [Alphaproteobacteria bacterium]|nr:DNA recombination protein RmuC [Alphaproteobacteria bacterium]
MDPTLILIIVGAVLAISLGTAALMMSRARGDTQAISNVVAQLSQNQSALNGRLAQVAESQSAAQQQMAENLRAQERALTQAIEQRLADMSKRVGDSLGQQAENTGKNLNALKERLAVIDSAQKNITELSTQVVGLQDILNNKQARGAFGEVQLENLVQSILPPNAYQFQAKLGNGRMADCLLTLPNPPGAIAVDSKFPLESYRRLHAAKDETDRVHAERAFRTDVLRHVKDIKERYIIPGETAESALMFIPSEAIYAELHAGFADTVEKSFAEKVWIVSPTTLMATLNTVRAVLKDARMREQAGVIQKEVLTLLKDVDRLDDRVGKLQRHFGQADEDIRQIRISTEKVTKRAQRIEEVQLGETEEPELVPKPDSGDGAGQNRLALDGN